MKPAIISALLAALSLISPSGAMAATLAYGSVGITPGSDIELRYMKVREACSVEAETPPRGSSDVGGFYYGAALRACLYRQGFSDQGEYAYPVPLFGNPSRYQR
jgi:hypothetical protein